VILHEKPRNDNDKLRIKRREKLEKKEETW
jgi:hypothetical protein